MTSTQIAEAQGIAARAVQLRFMSFHFNGFSLPTHQGVDLTVLSANSHRSQRRSHSQPLPEPANASSRRICFLNVNPKVLSLGKEGDICSLTPSLFTQPHRMLP
jgi:hypothetical protein